MAPSREIEKLQRRWQENPLGLTFAPLAEAYRKEGMIGDALALLDIGLAQHPNYVPAHIVKGRCFLDSQSDPDAERAFLRVADLDPENVIALKGLADIAERGARYPDAILRLERLLEFDRSNEEARHQLDRLRAHQLIPMSGTANLDENEVSLAAPAAPAAPAAHAQAGEPEILASPSDPPALSPSVEETPSAIELPRAEIVDAVRSDLEVVVFRPVELTANQTTEFQEPGHAESLEPAAARGKSDAGLEAEGTGAQVPEETVGPAATAEVVAMEEPEPPVAEGIRIASEAESPVVEPVLVDEEPSTDASEAEPDLVVTETMAEVFLRQGHRELALAVYTQLALRGPANNRIRGAIERLESELRASHSPILPVYAAVLTGGQSVRASFEQLLAARRPGAAVQPGELSLGSVFGDETTAAGLRTGVGGANPAAGPDPSFDEFYADSTEPEPTPSNDPPAVAEPGADDLEGFTDWLKGLRR